METARPLFSLWPKQQYAFDLIWKDGIEQLLYGGAAGGAKSHFVRALAAYLANLWPGSTVGIFRRSDPELRANHVEPWLETVDPFVPGGVWMTQRMEYQWPSPPWCWCEKGSPCPHSSLTVFRHVDDNRGARKHQGAEFAAELVDEATHFKSEDLDFLYTRVRAPLDKRNPSEIMAPNGRHHSYPGWPEYRRLQLLTANPGDVSHQYMLDNYIDPEAGIALDQSGFKSLPEPPHALTDSSGNTKWTTEYTNPTGELDEIEVDVSRGAQWVVEIDLGTRGKTQVRRAFVPASLADNPMLDPIEYAASLAIGSAEQRQRLLDGDWTYSEDKVFKSLSQDVHQISGERVFGHTQSGAVRPPPVRWLRGIGQDHGTAKPTAAVWLAYDDEGFFIAYREYYSPGPVGNHVTGIRQIMEWDGHPDLPVEADPRLWHKNQGVETQISIAAIYRHAGAPPADPIERRLAAARGIDLRMSHIEDKAALDDLYDMIDPSPDRLFPYWHPLAGQGGSPLLFITEACPMLWRELTNLKSPGMSEDGHYQEGLKTGQADHAYDALKRIAGPLRRRVTTPRRAGGPRYVLEAV